MLAKSFAARVAGSLLKAIDLPEFKKLTQHLETGYTQAFEQYKDGKPPKNITVF